MVKFSTAVYTRKKESDNKAHDMLHKAKTRMVILTDLKNMAGYCKLNILIGLWDYFAVFRILESFEI